jgi:hypothetical protein
MIRPAGAQPHAGLSAGWGLGACRAHLVVSDTINWYNIFQYCPPDHEISPKSNPNLYSANAFQLEPASAVNVETKDVEPSSCETGPLEISSDAKRTERKQKSSGKVDRPLTPSYKAFVNEINNEGKPPRPSSPKTHGSDSHRKSTLKSIDILIQSTWFLLW